MSYWFDVNNVRWSKTIVYFNLFITLWIWYKHALSFKCSFNKITGRQWKELLLQVQIRPLQQVLCLFQPLKNLPMKPQILSSITVFPGHKWLLRIHSPFFIYFFQQANFNKAACLERCQHYVWTDIWFISWRWNCA